MNDPIVKTDYLQEDNLYDLSTSIDESLANGWELYGDTKQYQGDVGYYFSQMIVLRKSNHPQSELEVAND